MAINSSSSVFHTQQSITSYLMCFISPNGANVFLVFTTTNIILILPLSILVFYVGFQRWRRQRSTSMVTATSHADLFTYHMVVMEIFSLVGSGLYCNGNYTANHGTMMAGYYIFSLVLPGQALFHCLTCVDRYLAVVHPIIYLRLRNSGAIRIRNISIGCTWLLCVGWIGVSYVNFPYFATVPFFILFSFSLFVTSFCSLSVLYTLTRPRPGEGSRDRADQSKKRAFHTILVITAALLLRFNGLIVCMVLVKLIFMKGGDGCMMLKSSFWLYLPSSLVLPLLFLHREGKPACFKRNTESR